MKYTVESFEEEFGSQPHLIVSLLESLKNSPKSVVDMKMGICYNLSNLLEEETGDSRKMGYEVVEKFSKKWKHHTGDDDYPVPASDFKNEELWKGEQLKYRIDLIDHIVKQLKEIK